MPGRLDLTSDQLAELLGDQPPFRIRQLRAGLLKGLEPEEMTDLPRPLRATLGARLPMGARLEQESVADGGRTLKWLWDLGDGSRVETVLMHYPRRSTVCVSTQAGCAMACSFCATGQMGFLRHLSAGEILAQVVHARRAATPRRLSNVVFMGMGEPLANYDATWTAVEAVHDELGISARQVTVSTVGIVPGIRRLAGERLPVNLAVSLHAADDALRDRLVPVNRRYPLAVLLDACAAYSAAKNRRLSFEWALIDGVNDTVEQSARLAAVARSLRAHVNLIPLNPTTGYSGRSSPHERAEEFCRRLLDVGVEATVRRNRGRDIDAACGQLAVTPDAGRGSSQPVPGLPAL